MRYFLLIISCLCLTCTGRAQLTGVKSIPGDYPSLAAAISALNAQGVGSGGVTFNLASGYTETLVSYDAGTITTLTSSASRPIVFQKSGSGTNPLITAPLLTSVPAGTRGIIRIAGSDYVTFNGIDLRENPGNSAPLLTDWGYALLKASETEGTQHATICNCAVTLNRADTLSTAIYSANHGTGSLNPFTVTSASGTNSWNRFYNLTLQNAYQGISLNGYSDAPPCAFYDQGNEIGKDGANNITLFGGGSARACGIKGVYQNGLKVASCTINGGTGTNGELYGISLPKGINASVDIYNNIITLASSSATSLSAGIFNAIGSEAGSVVNIYGNQVTGCTASSATTAPFYGIWNTSPAATVNIYNNTVNGNSLAGTGTMNLCWTESCGELNIYSNSIQNNQKTGASGTIYCIMTMNGEQNFYGNTIAFNTIPATSGTGNSAIYSYQTYSSDSVSFHNNSIHHMAIGGTATGNAWVFGFYVGTGGDGPLNVFGNQFCYLSVTTSGKGIISNLINWKKRSAFYFHHNAIFGYSLTGNGYVEGLYPMVILKPSFIYNNMISDLRATGGNNGVLPEVRGIYFYEAQYIDCSNNTIFLSASSSSAGFKSTGIYFDEYSQCSVRLRNNIVVNTSVPGANGFTAALFNGDPSFGALLNGSDNNCYYAGVPSPSNLIYYDGVNSCQTLSQYQAAISPREIMSVSELPPFVNIASAPYDIHLKTDVATLCESGGQAIGVPVAVTDDYDGNSRYPLTGYPNNPVSPAKAVDIGGDEFGGLWSDLQPPVISYVPLLNTSSGSARTLVAVIADRTGVPVTGAGLPRLYWKTGSGTWNAATGACLGGGSYSFTFGAGAAAGDVVSYYIAAQDKVSPVPNVGSYPSGASGFTFSPPAASTAPSSPSTYTIVQPICGNFNVGTGQVYATLTAAINDFNAREITCPVTMYLTDNTYGPAESFPIVIQRNNGSSATNTLTIKPAPGRSPQVNGAPPPGNVMVKVLCSNVVIDGSNTAGGTTRDLTLTNNSSTATTLRAGSTGLIPLTDFTLKNTNVYSTTNGVAVSVQDADVAPSVLPSGLTMGLGYFSNITILNNSIRRAKWGIKIFSVGVPGNGTGVSIQSNLMNGVGTDCINSRGIHVVGINSGSISGNEVRNMAGSSSAVFPIRLSTSYTANSQGFIQYNVVSNISTSGLTGIAGINGSGTLLIEGNDISNLYGLGGEVDAIYLGYTDTIRIQYNHISNIQNNTPAGWASGIYSRVSCMIRIIGNSISNVTAYGQAGATYAGNGIFTQLFGGKASILYNSINLPNAQTNAAGSLIGINVLAKPGSPYPDSYLDIRDNIIRITAPTGAGRYALSIGIPIPPENTNLDNNDYYSTGSSLFYLQGSPVATLTDWQAATGLDAHSLSVDPQFVSATDLHTNRLELNNAGVSIPGITTDIAGVIRSVPPDMGAYEFILPITSLTTLAVANLAQYSATLNGNINSANEVVGMSFEYGPTTAYGNTAAGLPSPVRSLTGVPVSGDVTGLVPNTVYHYRIKGISSTSAEVKYGADMTFVTLPHPSITGEDTLCVNSGYYNYLTEAGMSNYIWTISSGGVITSGQGTSQAEVMWNSGGTQWIAVNYTNAYGGTAPVPTELNVTVNEVPAAAGLVAGPGTLCAPVTGLTYSTMAIPGAMAYVWSLPPGAVITSGNLTQNITVDFDSTAFSGNVTVYGNNLCGNGTVSPPLAVTITQTPPTPQIQLNGNVLASNIPQGNQWYYEGNLIAGATGQSYTATQNGWYWDQATSGACVSDTSRHQQVLTIGQQQINGKTIRVFPVPCSGLLYIDAGNLTEGSYVITLLNLAGNPLVTTAGVWSKESPLAEMNLGILPDGVYSLEIKCVTRIIHTKVILKK